MNLRQSILGLATAAILTIGAAAPALAQTTPIEVDVDQAGALTLSLAFEPGGMSDIVVTAADDEFTSTGTVVLTLTDTRVNVDSAVSLSSTALTGVPSGTIANSAIGIVAEDPDKATPAPVGDPDSVATPGTATGTLGAPIALFSTDGAGTWTQSIGLTVTIPSTQIEGAYAGTLTVTDTLAPV